MKKQGEYDSLVAAFMKDRPADSVRIEENVRVYTERDMYLAARGEPVLTEDQKAEQRAERQAEQAMEATYHGRRVIGFDSNGNVETD